MAQWGGGGGVQNNNKAVGGLSVVPRSCQHDRVVLQLLREGGRGGAGASIPRSLSDTVSVNSPPALLSSYYTVARQPAYTQELILHLIHLFKRRLVII